MKAPTMSNAMHTEPRADLCAALHEGGLMDKPHPAASADEWLAAAASLDFWRIAVPCAGASSKASLLTKIADTLQFPDHFGMNLDALYDCLTDQLMANKKKGALLVLDGAAAMPREALASIVDTLLDAAEFLQPKGQRLCVVLR
jgi:RNAse (barnase) inhibitor barstar